MDFGHEFANAVATRFGHEDLLLPPDLTQDILAARPGVYRGL